MAFDDLLVGSNISASGLSGERRRMEVIANNIANAMSTRSANGGPYRRQEVLFEAIMNDQARDMPTGGAARGGVQFRVADDPSDLPRVFDPSHPDADETGHVTMPNVSLPMEMVNLMTASRSYEANLKVLQTLRQQLEQTLTLLRY